MVVENKKQSNNEDTSTHKEGSLNIPCWVHIVPSCSLYIWPILVRSVIFMWITFLMGGSYFMENPANSLVACHPRYVWMLKRLREIQVFVTWAMDRH